MKTPPLPFRPQPFLFRMLVLIFLTECGFLAYAFVKCSQPLPNNPVPLVNERCPRLGQRSQEIFQQAMAVTLSLLGGGALAGGFNQKPQRSLASDPALPSSQEQVPLNPQTQVQERVRESVQEKKGRPYTKKG